MWPWAGYRGVTTHRATREAIRVRVRIEAVADDLCQRIELDSGGVMGAEIHSDVEPPPRFPFPADRSRARITLIPAERACRSREIYRSGPRRPAGRGDSVLRRSAGIAG